MPESHPVNTDKIAALFKSRFGNKFYENHNLARYTTFGIGGPARYFVNCTERRELVDAAAMAVEQKLRFFVIGGGSNLLISDDGYSGLIIHVASEDLRIEDEYIMVDAGYDWESLVDRACRNGWGGLESMAGIKGSVGGAVYGNAGAFGTSIADILIEAEIFKPGHEPRWESNNYFAFSYRNSILKQSREIVLRVKLKYSKDDPEKLLKKQDEILELRSQRHPEKNCSAGCFFKNIEKADEPFGKLAAGFLLEKVGAKKMKIGGAQVFEKHANILMNSGKATAKEVLELAEILKKRVKDEYGYKLQEEITYLGD